MPWLGLADTKVSPAGSRSVTCTPVAASGPLLVSVTVKVIWSPTLGVGLLTVFDHRQVGLGRIVKPKSSVLLVSLPVPGVGSVL